MELRQARLTLALYGQRPAPPACSYLYPERKPLRGRQSQQGVGLCLHHRRLAAAAMQVDHPELGKRQTIGMGQYLGLGQGLLNMYEPPAAFGGGGRVNASLHDSAGPRLSSTARTPVAQEPPPRDRRLPIVPLVGVPETICRGLAPYREVLCRAPGL